MTRAFRARTLCAALIAVTMTVLTPLTSMAAGNANAGKAKAATCGACHGVDGNSVNPIWPSLAGQGAKYLASQIKAIMSKEGRNNANVAVMVPMVANLSDQDIEDLAAYYASLTPKAGTTPEQHVEPGGRLYRGGDKDKGIPACMSCHGPAGKGNGPAAFPRLAGQQATYAANQLKAYRDGSRTTDQGSIMRTIAAKMTDSQIESVSHFAAGLQ
jgi:cytochrome c553